MLKRLYRMNAALLVAHEIDSAYWKEWDLFHLPGGRAGFLLMHVPLLLVVLWGDEQVVAGSRAGLWLSVGAAGAGLLALGLHGWFLLGGGREFRDPVSLAVLVATAVVSLVQAPAAVRALRHEPSEAARA